MVTPPKNSSTRRLKPAKLVRQMEVSVTPFLMPINSSSHSVDVYKGVALKKETREAEPKPQSKRWEDYTNEGDYF